MPCGTAYWRHRYLIHDMKCVQCIVLSEEISQYTIYRKYHGNTTKYNGVWRVIYMYALHKMTKYACVQNVHDMEINDGGNDNNVKTYNLRYV